MSDLKKRKGIFRLSKSLVVGEAADENNLFALFSLFIPVFIEDNPFYDYKTYFGYSKLFDVLEEGETIPIYMPIINHDFTRIVSIEFKRQPA